MYLKKYFCASSKAKSAKMASGSVSSKSKFSESLVHFIANKGILKVEEAISKVGISNLRSDVMVDISKLNSAIRS